MTIDCLPLYAGLPSVRLASLERIQRSAARLTGKIPKFGHVTGYMLEVLRWFPVRLLIEYRVASLVWGCQLFIPPIYLTVLYLVLRVIASCALLERGCSLSCLLEPLSCKSALFVLVPRRCGITSLLNCAFCLGRFPTYSIVVLKLLFLL